MRMHSKEHLTAFALGALGYPLLELASRGRTHWSMALAGGGSFAAMHRIHGRQTPFALRCAQSALAITGIELATGLFVNRKMGWGVWDYSNRRGNLLGQVCPQYTLLWFGLSALGYPLSAALRKGFRR
jgi:hypothetical protein